jgi:hypothetical protein
MSENETKVPLPSLEAEGTAAAMDEATLAPAEG